MFRILVEIRPNELSTFDTTPVGIIATDRIVEVIEGEIIWMPGAGSSTSDAKVEITQAGKKLFTSKNVFNDKETSEKVGGYAKEPSPVFVTVSKSLSGLQGRLVIDLAYEETA